MRLCATLSKLYTQGQYHGKYREYFYYINHEGYLFLDDSRMKIFTAAYRDQAFLDFFYKHLRPNETERHEAFPYLSLCGRERNYLRCDDRPIVFTDILENGTKLKIGGSARTVELQPEEFSMLANGRLYHPAPFATYGLVKSSLADTLFPLFTFDDSGYPSTFRWNDMSAPGAPKKSRHTSLTRSVITNSHYSVDDQQLFCIRGDGIYANNDEKKYHQETYNMLACAGIDPVWMDVDDAMKVSKNDPHFYVLPSFSGKVFEHLEKTKCKLLSSYLICQCLQKDVAIPKKPHPIYSMHFSKIKVCFTGIPPERRKHLTKLVRYMNGIAEGNLFPTATHLVAEKGNYQSDKYRAAKTKRLPIIKPEWIEEAWEKALNKIEEDYSKSDIIEKFTLPLFNKMVLCTSGIGGQERSDLIRVVELNGGRSPGEMRRGECTHLITENTIGVKYKKAKEWGDVKIVTMRWVRKSVEHGYIQDESKYDPAKPQPAKNSTQIPGATAPKDLDVSSIYGPLKHTLNSQALKEHNLTRKENNPLNTPATMPRTQSKRLQMVDASNIGCLDQILDSTLKGDFDFFEGCSIFVNGIDKVRQEKINRILDRCGATRVNSIERASHIVVAAVKEDDRIELIQAQKTGVMIVRSEWLIACIEKKDLICADDYIWDADATLQRVGTATTSATSVVSNSRQSIHLTRLRPNEGLPFSNVLTTVSNQTHLESNISNSSSINSVFLDKTFRLHLLDADLITQLKTIIEENAGWVMEEDQDIIADYLVGSQVEYGAVPEPKSEKYKHLITENFVRYCIASKKLHDSHERPLFKPIPGVNGSQIFKDTVFGFVALGDIDKFTFSHLVRDFGGRIEASIVTRERDGIKPCTHIIAGEDNPKIDEFRRKLPHIKIVDPSWIIDCIINDKKEHEAKYLFKQHAYYCYEGRTDDFWQVSSAQENCRPASEMEAPRAGTVNNIDENLDINFDEPLEFQRCTTSTPKGPQNNRKSMESRFNPRFQIDGVTQILNEIPSPAATEEDTLNSSMSITRVGKMLSEAAIKTGQSPAEPQRSVTDPVINGKNNAVPDFYRPTPKSAKQVRQMGIKEDISVEAAKSSALMQKQMAYLFEQLKREPEETARSAVDPSQGSKRKRAHEMIQDTPNAPPPKRNISVLEPIVDWQPGQDQPDGDDFCVVEDFPIRNNMDDNPAPSVQEVTDNSLVISMEPPPAVEQQKPPCLAPYNSEIMPVEKTPQREAPPVRKSRSSKSKASIEESPMFSAESQKIFMFTGIHIKDREDFEKFVSDLGGIVAPEEPDHLTETTHLICGRLVRGTKLMGCIASGKWVLKPEYLLDSITAGKFLPEGRYEWGNPTTLASGELDEKEKQIARAAFKWRVRLKAKNQKGVFSGWKVLLYSAKEKAAGVIPLLLAGDAEVTPRENLQTSIASYKPTHAMIMKSPLWNRNELNEVEAVGSEVIQLDYIATLLLDGRNE